MSRAPYPSTSYHPHHARMNGHAASHLNSNAESNGTSHDKVASASTALDRVLGLLDGFEDDMDCPLCLEEMDISDLNFKPCPCGYQICRFCWHHIKENLNGLCPACRAPYDDETVEFKAIKPDELKRLQAAKKIRDKRRKDDALTVKNMANIRVRQRAQVHVQGMTTKIANEDTLNQLKGMEQFGQYGKVIKLFMSKRSSTVTQPASTHPHYQPVNVYVNYRTAAEASNCIAAIDGSTTGDGHKLKAIWGTTRYCPTYLKGGKCNNENCMQAHEPGEEIEGAGPTSREEMLTYHAMSDGDMQRSKASNAVTQIRKQQEAATLPPTASWATKNALNNLPVTPIAINNSLPPLSATLKPPPPPRAIPVAKPQTHPLPARPTLRSKATDIIHSNSSSTRPTSSDGSSSSHAAPPTADSLPAPVVEIISPVASSSSPSPPPIFSDLDTLELPHPNGNSFSHHARSIARPSSVPFPELDFGGGAFSFSLNLDVKGKGRAAQGEENRSGRDFANLDGFGRSNTASPVIPSPFSNSPQPGYLGSFDPFADSTNFDSRSEAHSGSSSPPPSADEMSRRSSRFGFARRGSSNGHGVKSGDLASALARSAFAGGRESPASSMGSTSFGPPGIAPLQNGIRPGSSIGFNSFTASSTPEQGGRADPSTLWPGVALPPALRSSFASPAHSVNSSPQLSPRTRAGMGYAPNGVTPTNSLPPGLSQNRPPPAASFPLPAASFPLPPAAPRLPGSTGGTGPGGGLGKDDLFALIAAAQASAPKPPSAPEIYPFSDPAILNARLASAPQHYAPSSLPPPNGQFHSIDHNSRNGGGFQPDQHAQQQQQLYQNQVMLQQQQQQQQQQAQQQQLAQHQQQQYHYGPPGVVRQPMLGGFRR